MDRSQLEQKISAVMDKNEVCSFATVEENKPHVRYMVLFHDGLTIYLATSRKTHKVEELEHNPHVHLIVGFDGTW
ncbi:pyridoxamine 5'-phosphate oxidase family protein, partial [Acinetobacter baumannii]|uniref:pyridoxamine 5'-phosphate oxidase family protein n=1 Tax=Acinetobacter baumannii TaxID=470 RepID=UPI000A5AEEC2